MNSLKSFLEKSLGIQVEVLDFSSVRLPPIFSKYEMKEVKMGKGDFIAMIDKQRFPARVKQTIGQMQWAKEILGIHTVYVSPKMDRLMRFRMRQKGSDYIDFSTEIHLPSLGCLIRDNYPTSRPVRTEPGFPAQRIVLSYLNHLLVEPITICSLRHQFGYSAVTVIQALKELELQGLVQRSRIQGSRMLKTDFVVRGRELWNRMQPHFKSPVREKISIDDLPDDMVQISSGETALAEISMLNVPTQKTIAYCTTAACWKALKEKQVVFDDGKYVVELWSYPPLLPGAKVMDPLTTILVTQDIAGDERVSGEQEEILEAFKW